MVKFITELFKRFTLPTPAFFNKLAWFGGVLASVALLFGQVATEYTDVAWVQWLAQYQGSIAAAGALILGVSKLAVKPEVPNQKL